MFGWKEIVTRGKYDYSASHARLFHSVPFGYLIPLVMHHSVKKLCELVGWEKELQQLYSGTHAK